MKTESKTEAPVGATENKRHGNTVFWIIIAVLLILLGIWTVWAGHQPDVSNWENG